MAITSLLALDGRPLIPHKTDTYPEARIAPKAGVGSGRGDIVISTACPDGQDQRVSGCSGTSTSFASSPLAQVGDPHVSFKDMSALLGARGFFAPLNHCVDCLTD